MPFVRLDQWSGITLSRSFIFYGTETPVAQAFVVHFPTSTSPYRVAHGDLRLGHNFWHTGHKIRHTIPKPGGRRHPHGFLTLTTMANQDPRRKAGAFCECRFAVFWKFPGDIALTEL
jgi:hypothetical protein